MTQTDREHMRAYFDGFAEGEWERLERDVSGRVSLEVHRRFLKGFISEGDRVLEIGAGPGRFTQELIDLGATVVVTDFSPVQLELNRVRNSEQTSIESWDILDISDASRYADGEFDAIVAYGGPLSYVFEDAEDALKGLFRIVHPSGAVLASVMSLLGTWRHLREETLMIAELIGDEANDAVMRTGDLRHIGGPHICQMFRASDVTALVDRCGGEVLAMSASNWASLEKPDSLASLEANPDRWRRFLEDEVVACAEPGALDGGTHILFAAQSVLAK